MTRWGMVVDLSRCIGCQTCTTVCKDMNHVPSGAAWRKVPSYRLGESRGQRNFYLPMNCMHCSDAPCYDVCPTGATFRHDSGVVDVDEGLCIGCGYCVVACPYLARSITHHNERFATGAEGDLLEMAAATKDYDGVATKCNFCLPRVTHGLTQGFEAGVAPQSSPVCVTYCIADALHFGDLDDPSSNVSQLIQDNKTARFHESLGTDTAVTYIVENTPVADGLSTFGDLVPARRQKVWKWPAVANFFMGSMGASLYLLGLLRNWVVSGESIGFKLIAPVLVALGLLVLTVEAGRPSRSIYLLRHLRRSWMSREALAGAIFLLSAVLDWVWPVFWPLAAAAAAGFVISQGFMLYRSRGVPAWNVPWMLPLFVTSSLASGSGFLLILAGLRGNFAGTFVLGATVLLLLSSLVTWLVYLYGPVHGSFAPAVAKLRRPSVLGGTLLTGYVLPVTLLLGVLFARGSEVAQLMAMIVAGFSIIAGVFYQKAAILLRAGYLRGMSF